MPVAGDETEKSAEARVEAAKLAEDLRPRIPALQVKLQGLAAGETAHLSIDGVAVPDAALGEPQKVDPGRHSVAARVGDGRAAREARGEAEVTEGQTVEITVTIPSTPAVPPPPPPSPPSGDASPVLVRAGFATAIAGGAVGLIAGVTALNKKGQLSGECPGNQCPTDTGGQQDLATAKTWANVSTVAFAVGGAGAIVGIIGLLTARGDGDRHEQASVSPWLGIGAAGVHGRF